MPYIPSGFGTTNGKGGLPNRRLAVCQLDCLYTEVYPGGLQPLPLPVN